MTGRRVVLLARAGGACERTKAALNDADATVVATFDPARTTVGEVRALSPDALLVVLDPMVEQELGRFDPLLADTSLDVMYEDAAVAARREGWEAARWARHLRAKLQGHHDVLPPTVATASPVAAEPSAFGAEMEALRQQVDALPRLAPAKTAGLPAMGAVVIAAGIGGPDASRQLLAALPAGFPRPVLLRQKIDGDQYERLVRQMARACAMPVALAQAGERLRPGQVHVLPDGLGLHDGPHGMQFMASRGGLDLSVLRQADSALVLLSGADPALVDAAVVMRWAGGLALGQSRENCFDPATSDALVARGGEALGLAQLSRQLLDRWPA